MNKDWRRRVWMEPRAKAEQLSPWYHIPLQSAPLCPLSLLSQLRPTAMPISVSCDGILETWTFVLEEVGCNHQLTTVQRQPNNPLGGNDFSATSSRDDIRNWWLRQMGTFYISVLTASRKEDFLSFDAARSPFHLLCSPWYSFTILCMCYDLENSKLNTVDMEGVISLCGQRAFDGSSAETWKSLKPRNFIQEYCSM